MPNPIAQYSFLPWLRQGLSAQMEGKTDALNSSTRRAKEPEVEVSLLLNATRKTEEKEKTDVVTIKKSVALYGPGDVIGIESRAIIKTIPLDGERYFEENYLPYIEFYEEDFPWRYTPLLPDGNRLRPWLMLIVLTEDEFTRQARNASRHLGSILLDEKAPLPPADQLWAWAHVQVNKHIAETELQDTINQNPHLAASRIICPRKLAPLTRYHAFLVPAFEKGRLAGLGAPSSLIDEAPLQLAAWDHPSAYRKGLTSFQNQLPIYHEWSFQTADKGEDIESLARKLQPQRLDINVGKRLVDMQSPGFQLSYLGQHDGEYGVLPAFGALHHPDAEKGNFLEDETPLAQEFIAGMQGLLNLEEDLRDPRQEDPAPNSEQILISKRMQIQ
ncbi:MAG: hypothetical protein R3B47_00940 [Bacteroidia bacterium]